MAAKKSNALKTFKKRRRSPAKKPSGATSNPPLTEDLVSFVLPGFAGYAGTRFLSRIIYTVIQKKYPKWAKHAGAASTIAAFLVLWLALHKWKKIEKYHTPAVVGSGIAVLQTIIRTYLKKYGWMVSDYENDAEGKTPAALPEATDDDFYGIEADAVGALAEYTAGSNEPPTSDLAMASVLNDGEDLDDLYGGSLSHSDG